MVSIRKKANKKSSGFPLRRKGRGQGGFNGDKEKVGLVAAGLCMCLFVAFLYNVAFSESSGEPSRAALESLRRTKRHPVLMETTEDNDASGNSGNGNNVDDPNHPPITHKKKIVPMGDGMNAIALDIISTLDCASVFADVEQEMKRERPYPIDDELSGDSQQQPGRDDNSRRDNSSNGRRRRRLQQHGDDGGFADFGSGGGDNVKKQKNEGGDDSVPEERWGDQVKGAARDNIDIDADPVKDEYGYDAAENMDKNYLDDFVLEKDDDYAYGHYLDPSAKHLFCLAATESPPAAVAKEIACDAGKRKRRTLLDLWSAARAQMSQDLLLSVLDLAREQNVWIQGKNYNIWTPKKDEGSRFMVTIFLDSKKDVDNGGLYGLEDALGPGKVFVDVGSCLGLTCLVINNKYPGTKIVSIEPASPNWLLQEINLRCNLPKKEFKKIKVVLAGVGTNTDDEDDLMAKLMWRPTSTTSTRSWTPADEHKPDDIELIVRLRKLKSILAEADVLPTPTHPHIHIDVMNLDCQGCEYNLVPALSEEEYEEIPTVIGNAHWGYIKPNKLPSSERGKITHQRMCQHENIARHTKECCAFPDLPVQSSIPGTVLQNHDSKNSESTVSDVVDDELCADFPEWAKEHYLNDIPDDFNWFELSSQGL